MQVRQVCGVAVMAALAALSTSAAAQKRYGPGVSDTEILIGQTMPYSGPASAYGTTGRAQAAYFAKINAEGGIRGRAIRLISLDDGYSPPRTVEQVRRLVEQDGVLLLFSVFGTPPNTAVVKYLNAKRVPHLFIASGAAEFADAKRYPWTIGWRPNYRSEGRVYARYVLRERPHGKLAVLWQHDDVGRDYIRGLREGLGDRADRMLVAEASYEVTDPTVDSQIVALKSSGADVLLNFSTPKAAAQAIRKVHDLGWKPLHIVGNPAASVATVFRPAGLEKAVGVVSAAFMKDPTDTRWHDDPGYRDWLAWMKRYYPDGDVSDFYNVYAYSLAQTLVRVLEQCEEDLTRENVMRQANNLRDLQLPMLLHGIDIDTGPDDHEPIEQMQMQRFDGAKWVLFGDLIRP